MARLMGFATHHKGGTIWIKRTLKALSQALGIPMIGIWGPRHMHKVPDAGRAFLVNWHGSFPVDLWAREDVVFAHVIRDPRDILLSGMSYHRTAGVKGEKFLHEPRADLNGATYQEHLNALPDDAARLMFEMDGKHAETLAEMLAWPSHDPRSFELRYEDLMQDHEGRLFARTLAHLGLSQDELAAGRKAFWDNSIFGGLAKEDARSGRLSTHIQSGKTTARWPLELPRTIGRAYAARFGDALNKLGYAQNDDWVSLLPEEVAA